MVSCGHTEFNYTLPELREVWAIREKCFDVYFAWIQWCKKRGVIDDPTLSSMMRSILEDMEKIVVENDVYEFDEVFSIYESKWMNRSVKTKE